MNPLLFILHDDAAFHTYRWLCEMAGIECLRAEGGLHALTQLERTQVSAIICDTRLSDMKALELLDILRSDPVTSQLPFFLRTSQAPAHFSDNDMVLEPELCTPLALGKILKKLQPDMELSIPLTTDATPDLYNSSGTFAVPELITWLNENQKTGHWLLRFPNITAYLIMQAGELIYGEMGQERGQGSLIAILLEMSNNKDEEIFYYAVEQLFPNFPQNINVGTKHLLITSSVAIDHIRADIIG